MSAQSKADIYYNILPLLESQNYSSTTPEPAIPPSYSDSELLGPYFKSVWARCLWFTNIGSYTSDDDNANDIQLQHFASTSANASGSTLEVEPLAAVSQADNTSTGKQTTSALVPVESEGVVSFSFRLIMIEPCLIHGHIILSRSLVCTPTHG